MGKWIALLTLLFLLAAVFFFGADSFFSSDPGIFVEEVTSLSEGNTITARHAVLDGIHRYSGIFRLPHSCYSVDQSGVYQNERIDIFFTVVDMKAEVSPCIDISTRYPFTVLVEAPEGTKEFFYLNGEEVPSNIRQIRWQSPSGTYLDPGATTLEAPR